MLPLDFFGQNAHFVISLFAALVFFAVFWLYFDAWLADRGQVKGVFKWVGFLLISLSFVSYATVIEHSALSQHAASLGTLPAALSQLLRVLGYVAVIISELMDPLQKKPEVEALDASYLRQDELEDEDTNKTNTTSRKTVKAVAFGSLSHP